MTKAKDDIKSSTTVHVLTPEGVKQYERSSGFKTTGHVTVTFNSDKAQQLYENLLLPKRK